MSFLKSLFGERKTVATIVESIQKDIFKIYGVSKPTDVQKMKASVYICIAGIALLNDVFGGKAHSHLIAERLRNLIDELVEETKEVTKPLSMKVGELVDSKEDLEKILAYFPEAPGMNESTILNGLAAFAALYNTQVEMMTGVIRLSDKNNEFGMPGFAPIVVANGIFGMGKGIEHLTEVAVRLNIFARELGEVGKEIK
jgi:hypothetical protein